MSFATDLPALIAADLKTAFEKTGRKGLGTGSYQGPTGSPCYFIVERTKLGGGQSLETSEYTFQGGWSNRTLNKKVQTFTATVSICGRDYMSRRNALVQALDQGSDDDASGTLELPSWGRMPVVVQDWEIEEDNDKQRLTTFSLTFVRTGLSVTSRLNDTAISTSIAAPLVQNAAQQLKSRACLVIEKSLPATSLSTNMVRAAFGVVVGKLQELIGRIQAVKGALDSAAAGVQELSSLIAQGVSAPKTLAIAMFGAFQTIASVVLDLLDTEDLTSQVSPVSDVLNSDLNGRNVLLQLLADPLVLDLPVGSSRDSLSLAAVTAAYRAGVFYAAALILPSAINAGLGQARDLFNQFTLVEARIDRSDPDMYRSCSDLRAALNLSLASIGLEAEKTAVIHVRSPLLALSSDLGIPTADLERLNLIEDQHALIGEITYV